MKAQRWGQEQEEQHTPVVAEEVKRAEERARGLQLGPQWVQVAQVADFQW